MNSEQGIRVQKLFDDGWRSTHGKGFQDKYNLTDTERDALVEGLQYLEQLIVNMQLKKRDLDVVDINLDEDNTFSKFELLMMTFDAMDGAEQQTVRALVHSGLESSLQDAIEGTKQDDWRLLPVDNYKELGRYIVYDLEGLGEEMDEVTRILVKYDYLQIDYEVIGKNSCKTLVYDTDFGFILPMNMVDWR